jgi:hypothetical protein
VLSRLIFIAYFLEVGIVLVVAPWSTFWDRNYFTSLIPHADTVLLSPYLRGAISGLGALTFGFGLIDLITLVFRRPAEQAESASSTS